MFPIEICYIFKNTFFYRISPVAASAFIRSTHAFWIKLLETPVQVFSCEFYEIIKNIIATSGGCFFLSQGAKYQNTGRQLNGMDSFCDGKYNKWDNRFLSITEAYLELSPKSTMKLFCKSS